MSKVKGQTQSGHGHLCPLQVELGPGPDEDPDPRPRRQELLSTPSLEPGTGRVEAGARPRFQKDQQITKIGCVTPSRKAPPACRSGFKHPAAKAFR